MMLHEGLQELAERHAGLTVETKTVSLAEGLKDHFITLPDGRMIILMTRDGVEGTRLLLGRVEMDLDSDGEALLVVEALAKGDYRFDREGRFWKRTRLTVDGDGHTWIGTG